MVLSSLWRRAPRAVSGRGFSLIELIVVAGIISVVSGMMLASNSRFGGAITLKNLAYDVAISIRQAQVYGISVARFGAGTFSAGYGIHFSRVDSTHYVLFADAAVENGLYNVGGLPGEQELVAETTIDLGYSVSDLCITDQTDTETCGLSELDIFFKRPEPDAYINANGAPLSFDSDGRVISTNLPIQARIVLSSPRGDTVSVVVEATGQIAVL
jgi:prepilin-type N-terminal cleavage/methylation domain-containing protein